jgi:hypothetical protein
VGDALKACPNVGATVDEALTGRPGADGTVCDALKPGPGILTPGGRCSGCILVPAPRAAAARWAAVLDFSKATLDHKNRVFFVSNFEVFSKSRTNAFVGKHFWDRNAGS